MKWFKFNKEAKDLSEYQLNSIFDHIQENVGKYSSNEKVYKNGAERYLGYIFYPKVEKFFIAYTIENGMPMYTKRYSKDLESCRNQVLEEFEYVEDFQFEVIPYPFKEI